MSRTDPSHRTLWQLVRAAARRAARAVAVTIGFGLGSAWAADAVRLAIPEAALTEPAPIDDLGSSQWQAFDPGFIADHLPFKITIGQAISYNDNVLAAFSAIPLLANSGTISRLPERGDFYSDTTLGVASRFPMGAETFFFNGTYSPRRYFTDTVLDADNYAINGGVDFNVDNRCTGRLIGGTTSNQNEQIETVGFGTYTNTTTSFNETARCVITGHIAGLFNSGVSSSMSSGGALLANGILPFSLNDYMQHYVGIGAEYTLTGLDVLRGNATFTDRNFTNRPVGLGLSQDTQQNDFIFFYGRTFSAKLDADASGGISVFELGPGTADVVEPTYAFHVNYHFTPRLSASISEARSSGAPQSAISNIQINDTQALTINFLYSPKLNFSGILSRTEQRNPGLNTAALANSLVPYINANIDSASVVANYTISPLASASASYSYNERTDTSRSGFRAVSNVFRVGLLYTR